MMQYPVQFPAPTYNGASTPIESPASARRLDFTIKKVNIIEIGEQEPKESSLAEQKSIQDAAVAEEEKETKVIEELSRVTMGRYVIQKKF